jgi:hypothetical protein
MQGYLKKKPPSMLGGWQKRWFNLQKSKLEYYADDDVEDLRGHIPLGCVLTPRCALSRVTQ